MSSHTNTRRMNINNVNPLVKAAKYAVRGELTIRAEALHSRLEEGNHDYPFEEVISAHIGNPQGLGQKPITFFRQVLSLLEYPALLDNEDVLLNQLGYQADVLKRAKWLLKEVKSVGSYSPSRGVPAIKKSIAHFLEERDGYPASQEDIYLTAGASVGVSSILQVLCAGPKTGILVPIPQYPIYSASLSLLDARCVPYHLDESKKWGVNWHLLEAAYDSAKSEGIEIRGIVVINPGNPTGAVLSAKGVQEVIDFASTKRLVIIADEVYQTNVFYGKFHSFKSVLRTMQAERLGKYESVELVSLHSVSKGVVGECGHRGGYFELVGFDDAVAEQIYKVVSLPLCAPVIGQCMVELMVNPPREGEPSYLLYKREVDSIFSVLRQRANSIYEAILAMRGVSCANPQGSLYVFPTITLPQKARHAASEQGLAADEYYCQRLLDSTGICIVPGTGFGQKEGTFHLRSTFLPEGTKWVDRWVQFHNTFWEEFE